MGLYGVNDIQFWICTTCMSQLKKLKFNMTWKSSFKQVFLVMSSSLRLESVLTLQLKSNYFSPITY